MPYAYYEPVVGVSGERDGGGREESAVLGVEANVVELDSLGLGGSQERDKEAVPVVGEAGTGTPQKT